MGNSALYDVIIDRHVMRSTKSALSTLVNCEGKHILNMKESFYLRVHLTTAAVKERALLTTSVRKGIFQLEIQLHSADLMTAAIECRATEQFYEIVDD